LRFIGILAALLLPALSAAKQKAWINVKWFKGYKPDDMSFRYDSMHGWQ
jgi:hypothetical protein